MKNYFNKLSEKLGQNRHTKMLALIFIVGIILLLFPTERSDQKTVVEEDPLLTYRAETEARLSQILSRVKGVGKAEVMITFADSGQTFFAEDTEEQRKGEQTDFSAFPVLKNDGSGTESPLVTKKVTPEISGVLVVAQGAGQPQVKTEIIHAVRALLGVKAHRIEVLEKK